MQATQTFAFLFFFLRYLGLNAGAFYLRAMPPALVFILYFENGSHEVVEGLTKERERETETETETERELRLAANPDPLVSASQSTGLQACATTPGFQSLLCPHKRTNQVNTFLPLLWRAT